MEDKMSVLRDLQAQRNDVVGKLKRIEDKKASVSAEVYEKVKKEYADKLKGIDDELSGHIDLLTEEIQRLKDQEDVAVQSMKETKFKMEEVELRYSIGEYDEASFKKAKREGDARMSQLDGELRKIQENIQYYSAIMKGKEPEPAKPVHKQPVERDTELKIDEHILEEKLPEEEVALEELLSEEDAVKPEAITDSPGESGAAEDKGVACPKCGHSNTADSWYCEKCGAEILGASGSS
ncbi:MAG: zinc ribbon domain-containing protein [candidate division WOR-3 bacterium]|nr:MAG: zinc ribbon domain-containing protein [candidate division WOR-3 bacterium]